MSLKNKYNPLLGKNIQKLSNFEVIDITYTDLKDLVNGFKLVEGAYYKIIDYNTVVDAGMDVNHDIKVYSHTVEPLLVKAVDNKTLDNHAVSTLFPSDIIEYDVKYEWVLDSNSDGGWFEATGDRGDPISVSDVNANDFLLSNISPGSDFSLVLEDASNYYGYFWEDLNIKYTLVKEGDEWRVTLMDTVNDPINLIGTGSGMIEVMGSHTLLPAKGKITSRKQSEKGITTSFDFRGVRRFKYKCDATSLVGWVSTANYINRNYVTHDNSIWKCLIDNINQPPADGNSKWIKVIDYIDNSYIFSSGSKLGELSVPVDENSFRYIPVFGKIDNSTGEVTYSLENVSNIVSNAEDVLFLVNLNGMYDIHVESNVTNTVIQGSAYSLNINSNSNYLYFSRDTTVKELTIVGSVEGVTFSGNITKSVIEFPLYSHMYLIYKSTIKSPYISNIKNSVHSDIGSSNYSSICNAHYSKIGNGSTLVYFEKITRSSIGEGMNNVTSKTYLFSYNTIGNYFKYTTINTGLFVTNNVIGDNVGGSSSDKLIISNRFEYNNVGDRCFNDGGITAGDEIWRNTFGKECHSIESTTGKVYDNVFGDNCNNIIATSITNNHFARGCKNISAGGVISSNSFNSKAVNVVSSNSITANTVNIYLANITASSINDNIFTNVYNFTTSSILQRNIISNSYDITANILHFCTILGSNSITGGDVLRCSFRHNVGLILGDVFNLNEVSSGVSNEDFTSGSHSASSYPCKIFKRSDGANKLSYIDEFNNTIITEIDD